MVDALLEANRAAGNRLAKMKGVAAEGVLDGTSLQARAFSPGHRAADGGLGDDRGATTIRADDGRVHRWTLHDTTRLDGADHGVVAEADGPAVSVLAGEGGTYLLRTHDGGNVVGEILLSVPYLIHITHSFASMARALNGIGVPAPDHERRWSAVIQVAKRVATHVLRPVNVRLNWQGQSVDEVLANIADPAIPSLMARRTDGATPLRAIGLLIGPEEALLDPAQRRALSRLRPAADMDDDIAWNTLISRQIRGTDGAAFAARVSARLGGDVEDIDEILAGLAAAGANDAGQQRWAEATGRLLGVTVGRAVLRALGLRPGAAAENDRRNDVLPCEVIARSPVNEVHSLLGLHRQPGAAIADLPAALASVAEDASPADRRTAMRDGWGDLVGLFNADWDISAEATTGYDVLAGLVSTRSLDSAQLLAPLPGPYGRRTLAPGSIDADVDDAGAVRTPARYGSEADDPDDRRTAVTDLQTDLRRLRIDYGLEPAGRYGYRRIAFQGNVLDPAVFDGLPGDVHPQHGAALSRLVQRGYTALAIREFQIAGRYPNDVVEQLTVTEPYADRLAVSASDEDRADDGTPGTPLDEPDGELEPVDAIQLQQWIFARRRLPVVIEVRERTDPNAEWAIPNTRLFDNPHADNLLGPNDVNDNSPRMFVLDLSGMPQQLDDGVVQERRRLGDYGGVNGYGGPHAGRSHTIEPIGLTDTFGADSTVHTAPEEGEPDPGLMLLPPDSDSTPAQVRGWFRAVWDVLLAVTERETGGRWDGFNGWDSAVWSYPIFHYTLRIGHGRPGKMPDPVSWLQAPDANIPAGGDGRDGVHAVMRAAYQRAFGRYGVGAGPVGIGDPTGYLHVAGLRRVAGGAGAGAWEINMEDADWHAAGADQRTRMEVFYDSYVQWFRSWQWAVRFARNLRFDATLQRLLVAHGIDWIIGAMERNVHGGVAHTLLTTKRAAVAYTRAFVRFPAEATNGFEAVPDGVWQRDQEAGIRAFIGGINNADLRATTTAAVAELDGDMGLFPTPDQLRQARDWVLRSLL